jgi:hypothetical protein
MSKFGRFSLAISLGAAALSAAILYSGTHVAHAPKYTIEVYPDRGAIETRLRKSAYREQVRCWDGSASRLYEFPFFGLGAACVDDQIADEQFSKVLIFVYWKHLLRTVWRWLYLLAPIAISVGAGLGIAATMFAAKSLVAWIRAGS